MIGLNSYINDIDFSSLKEYCVNHGRITKYANGDYFVKAGEESRYIAYVECGYFNYMVHNTSEQKDYITGLDEFERKCREKGILEGNVIWGLSAKDFPDLKPEDSSSLYYVGAEEI